MSAHIFLFLMLINLKECRNALLKGRRARQGQFPWLIQFQTVIPCGGVLLSPDWVLTAAQCVQDKRSSILLLATGFNGTDLKKTVPIKATFIHPRYQAYSIHPDQDHNVALLKLAVPFDTCSSRTFPDVVPIRDDTVYKSCVIFGWQSYLSPSSKVLAKPVQYSEVILNSWKLCTYMLKADTNLTNVFCAMIEFKDETKACSGNPGSPVVCKNEHNRTIVVGIASWTNYSLECGDLPTYLNLDGFRAWLHGLMSDDKQSKVGKTSSNDKRNSSWNDTNLLQINYWAEDTKIRLQNVSGTSFNEMPTESVVRGKSNGVYIYEDIGKPDSSKYQHTFKILNTKYDDFNKSLLCNKKKFDVIAMEQEDDQTELDDFEFLLSFAMGNASPGFDTNIFYCKCLRLFYIMFWYFYYTSIYT